MMIFHVTLYKVILLSLPRVLQLAMATSFSPSFVALVNLANPSVIKFGTDQDQEQSSKTCHILTLFKVEPQLSVHTLSVVAQVVVSLYSGMIIQLIFLRKSWESCLGGLKPWDA